MTNRPLLLNLSLILMGAKSIKIVQQNTRKSITAVNEIKQKISELQPDFVMIQEPYVLQGKVIFDLNSRIFQHEGSDHIYTATICLNSTLIVRLIKDYSTNFCTTIGVSCDGRNVIVANVYIQPDQLNETHMKFLNDLSTDYSAYPLIICGDFNSRSPVWFDNKTNHNGAIFRTIFTQTDLILQNDKTHTCVTHNGSSLIDLTLANSHATGSIYEWRVRCLSTITDHRAIIFQMDLSNNLPVLGKSRSNWAFSENNADWTKFSTDFENRFQKMNLTDMTSRTKIDDDIKAISDQLIESAYATLRCNSKPTMIKRTPVWSKEVELLQLHFRHLRNLHCKKKVSTRMYNAARNKYIRAYRKLRKTVFINFAEQQNSNDPYGNTFKILEKRLATAPQDIPFVDALDGNGQMLQMQCLLDKLFPDDDALTDTAEVDQIRRHAALLSNHTQISFEEREVKQVIGCLKAKKSPGIDKISNCMIKSVSATLSESLTKIFNSCMNLSYFPTAWKSAKVQVLPKPNKSDYSVSKSYRPIALTPHLSKIFEKLIRNRLLEHLTLNERQHGFMKNRSTVSALRIITNLVLEKKADHKVAVIAIDISGAFDNAFWPAIIKRLDSQNVPASLISIIKSYLNGREMVFDYQGRTVKKFLTKGTPQGGVLSPLLWNIILDELLESFDLPDCELVAYADDVTIICWNREERQLRKTIKESLQRIDGWCESRKLKFCSDKTNLLYVHCKEKHPINFNDSSILPVENIKILGVTFGDHRFRGKLNFNPHVLDVITRATRTKNALFALAKKSWGINSRKRLILYKTVVRSMIIYAAEIWFPHLNGSARKKLDSMQYCFLKHAIQAFNTVSYAITHAMADIPTLSAYVKMRLDREPADAYKVLIASYVSGSNETFREFFPETIPKYVKPNFHNMQFFSNHGHFGQYLARINVREDDLCSCGNDSQDAKHLLLRCEEIFPLKHPLLRHIDNLHGFVSDQPKYLLFNDLCRTISDRLVKARNRLD